MKIMFPFSAMQEKSKLYPYVEEIEIYTGFRDENWEKIFNNNGSNKMSSRNSTADLPSLKEFISFSKIMKKRKVPVFLTLNNPYYTDAQIEYIIKNYLGVMYNEGISGIIVGCETLIDPICDVGLRPVASTILGIYNAKISDHYFKCGVKRQIIPRDMSLNEIFQIKKNNPNISLEVFLMRNGCRFSDAYCLCIHGERGGLCRRIDKCMHYYVCDSGKREDSDIALTDLLYTRFFHQESCGLCSIWRVNQMGITSGKIVGRNDDPQRVIHDLELCVANLRIANQSKSEDEYLQNMIKPQNETSYCRYGYSCYYPEIRHGGV